MDLFLLCVQDGWGPVCRRQSGTGMWMAGGCCVDGQQSQAHSQRLVAPFGLCPISGSCGEAWMLVPIFLPFNLNRGSGSWGLALALTLAVIHFHHWEWSWGEITVLRLSTGMTRCAQGLFF